MRYSRINLSGNLAFFAIGGILALLSANPFLSFIGVVGLLLLIKFFWTRHQPAIIFWALIHQWLQINIALIYMNLLNEDMAGFFRYQGHAHEAYLLGMAGWLAFGVGLWVMTRKLLLLGLGEWLERLNPRKCMRIYLAFFIFSSLLPLIKLPGLGQLLIVAGMLKWGFFYIFFSSVFYSGRYKLVFALCMAVEFILSLFSYFSSSVEFLLMPLILIPVFFKGNIRVKHVVIISFLGGILISFALVWTAIKDDYRVFLQAGNIGQVIRVERGAALAEMGGLIGALDSEKVQAASLNLVARLSYLDYLSGVMSNIPTYMPHENGSLALGSIRFVLSPRILFPNKGVTHDTQVLNKYIGEYVANYRTTSMSMGYVANFYVDFGIFAPLAILFDGLLIGFVFRFLFRKGGGAGWGVFLVMPLFFMLYKFEMEFLRQIGMIFTYVVIMVPFTKFVLPVVKRNVEIKLVKRDIPHFSLVR